MQKKCKMSRSLVPHLRHRHIEDLHEGTDLDATLHDVPLDPLLRSRLKQCRRLPRLLSCWPRSSP